MLRKRANRTTAFAKYTFREWVVIQRNDSKKDQADLLAVYFYARTGACRLLRMDPHSDVNYMLKRQ
jgi:hypothetical protein